MVAILGMYGSLGWPGGMYSMYVASHGMCGAHGLVRCVAGPKMGRCGALVVGKVLDVWDCGAVTHVLGGSCVFNVSLQMCAFTHSFQSRRNMTSTKTRMSCSYCQ